MPQVAVHHQSVALSSDDFVGIVLGAVPEVRPIVLDHTDEHGEVHLHLLVSDLRRYCLAAFDDGRSGELMRCLGAITRGVMEGDTRVFDAVAVAFVEDTGWWDPSMIAFMATWPRPLKAEAERQWHAGAMDDA